MLMMAWMNEGSAPDARDRPHVVGAAPGRSCGARARRRATASGCAAPPTTAMGTRSCSRSSRRVGAHATPGSGPASSGRSVLKPDKAEFHRPRPPAPGRPRLAGAAGRPDHTRGGVRPPGGGRAGVPPGVRRARGAVGPVLVRGRNPQATLVVHGSRVEVEGDLGAEVPRDSGALAALDAPGLLPVTPSARAPAAARRRHRLPRLRRGPGGRAPPGDPARRPGPPRRRPVDHR